MIKLVSALVVIVIILSFGVMEQVFINETFEKLKEDALKIEGYISNEEYDKASTATEELLVWWRDKRNIVELISPHNEVKDHITLLAQLQGQLQVGSYDEAEITTHMIREDADNKLGILSYRIKNVL